MSSSTFSTPRKRKAGVLQDDTDVGVSGGKTRKRAGPPTPNPPLVPFPTPPATRHRKATFIEPTIKPEELATPPGTPSKRPSISSETLPPHLQSLLNHHHSFNLALSLYIATHLPVLPPHPPSATSVPLPNLTNLLALKETVERTSGRRFGVQELSRLAWVWTWDGKDLPDDKAISERNKQTMLEEDNPFLVSPSSTSTSNVAGESNEVSGLSYLITPTRTLDPSTGRRVYTHGLGIELELRQGETRQILHGGAEGGLGNKGQGGGVGAIGRWNANGETRHEVFRERLERWVELHGGYQPPAKTALPTPTTSEHSTRSSIPPIPILPLPHLPSSTLLPAANLFSSFSSPGSTSASSSSTPRKASTSGNGKTTGLSDPFEIDETKNSKVIRTGSVEERRQAMMDRIKARSGNSKAPISSTGVSGSETTSRRGTMSASEQQEELKRRSTLSRLESIAEAVWMMFSAPSPGPSTLPTPPRGRRKAIPMTEAADVIVKSSKTPISTAEAQTSLSMLTDLCPFFLTIKTIGKQEWIEMPSALSTLPISPGSNILTSTSISTGLLVQAGSGAGAPASPGSVGRVIKEIAGPASPGRVRRGGGLREVREKIRRELGE